MSNKKYKSIGDPFDCLAEECAEVIQILMKIKRFGLLNHHPDFPEPFNNAVQLEDEMKDVEARISEVRAMLAPAPAPSHTEDVCEWQSVGLHHYLTACGRIYPMHPLHFGPENFKKCMCDKPIKLADAEKGSNK